MMLWVGSVQGANQQERPDLKLSQQGSMCHRHTANQMNKEVCVTDVMYIWKSNRLAYIFPSVKLVLEANDDKSRRACYGYSLLQS